MRLKRIKLAGFKSFVEPTSIPFPGSMTAIVGPNGCGKSNVIDAVRWVLGESSAKNLRGDAMTDVIFNGSTSRKPVGQCSVELVFDNTAGRLGGEFANYVELSVKRLVTREAQSHYFLNSAKCRRRDITDLFLGTGLGPRSYAIIEQGMISRLIESKPQELRVFIEEAAGISKYKERRRETENRIKHTLENLERLADVRGELGQQLDKLQRQAAAAQRYTSLKAQERQLKSELAVIRYLALNDTIKALDEKLNLANNEYESLKARLRGDEAGIEEYKEKQREISLSIDDKQQHIFSLATQITRAEEAGQYKSQRLKQIDALITQLSAKTQQAQGELQIQMQERERASEQLAKLEPELELCEAQKYSAQESREEAEESLHDYLVARRSADDAYHAKKQATQQCHSQIQSTMSMQMRTQQRLKELMQERSDINDDMLQGQCKSLQNAKDSAHVEEQSCLAAVQQSKAELDAARKASQDLQQQVNQANAALGKNEATIDALQALQVSEAPTQQFFEPLWQKLEVTPGYEKQVELALAHWGDPAFADSQSAVVHAFKNDNVIAGKRVTFFDNFSVEKPPKTLASFIENDRVPELFTRIHCVDSEDEAFAALPGLPAGQSVMALSGLWISSQWLIFGVGERANGALQRRARLHQLQQEKGQLVASVESIHNALQLALEKVNEQEVQWEQATTALKNCQTNLADVTQRHGLVAMQIEQNQARAGKLNNEIYKQQDLLEQEQAQLEKLSEQVEELEADIFELEIMQQDAQQKQTQLQETVNNTRQQYERITQQQHGITLTVQTLSQTQKHKSQACEKLNEQREEMQQSLLALEEEQRNLQRPAESDSAQLQQWLSAKYEAEQEILTLQNALSDVNTWLEKAQRDQQGIQQAMQQQQALSQSIQLESEGFRVRAASILEQLSETGYSVKNTLETLPEDAQETQWQQKLEQTTASVKRLGAVNLAAVDEYKVQAERKQHLDEQDHDLNEALNTLQSAIRKIDKETRSRFSATFEQVNDDLKSLFPKVFGGGTAYLALTDDDLLETGVTIMARPPGKKNSTIHLLSGGEKALTALSLVFAIFRLNPAPFCLLDEVDAPLDDANVVRFCKLVSEMSGSVQFIYITHNKIAMEMASHLTGVTMAEPGVSRMVAVDVEEAVSLVQA